jgi:hypothetical protein
VHIKLTPSAARARAARLMSWTDESSARAARGKARAGGDSAAVAGRLARAEAEQVVQVHAGGRVWSVPLPALLRVADSVPCKMLQKDSPFLGNSVRMVAGCWHWTPADQEASPADVHAVLRWLASKPGTPGAAPARTASLAALAARWGLHEAMFG